MTTTVHRQNTAALPAQSGALTVPLEIIRARHRAAVAAHRALPAWALAATTAAAFSLIGFAVLAWRPGASQLLIAFVLIGAACAFAPDVLPMRESEDGETISA